MISAYGFVALNERKSKNVNVARRCWIYQVTRVMLVEYALGPGEKRFPSLTDGHELRNDLSVLYLWRLRH